jgi:hypothetical protein
MSNGMALWKSLFTWHLPGGVEVPESEEAEGDGSGACSGISPEEWLAVVAGL